ncbi:class I SAM-dependent methyltransferase [Paraburkholderia agricolaris]|uniref:S-adenosyl-L-methionine-dependent methyltransferase n=1 Tax=Paraburkholderia agricolaris TaxID=2152888 RepID=A0ABW8ZMK6_9BURK
MREQEPSRTAFAAATHRAVHQVVEKGKIFSDPLALTIVGMKAEDVQHDVELQTSRRGIRLFIAARSRYAEVALERAVEQRGVRQIVILGAGLDTFAHRHRLSGNLRIFEVDHPATQAWKRRRLEQAGIEHPDSLIYAPVDFESDTLLDGLNAAGFESTQRSFFIWLGVVPYLTEKAIDLTLGTIASLAGGAEVVFDYSDPPASFSADLLALHEARAARVAAVGEPFLSYFDPPALHEKLRKLGFSEIDDVMGRRLVSSFLEPATTAARSTDDGGEPRSGGGHVLFAATKFV